MDRRLPVDSARGNEYLDYLYASGLGTDISHMNFKKGLYATLGIIATILGIVGILLPLLPTTPFLLLASFLFARSNARLNRWLLHHRRLGPYIQAFRGNTGLTREQKVRMACSFSILLAVSVYFAPITIIRVGLAALWMLLVSLLLLMRTAPRA